MARKKINNNIKKSATLMGLIVTLTLVIGFFAIMYTYLFTNTQQAGVENVIDSRYNDTYNNLVEQQSELNATVTDIQTAVSKVTEADNTYQSVWNGFLFLGTVILSFIPLVQITTGTYGALVDVASAVGVSPFVIVMATTCVIAFVVFLIISNLKGEPKMIN